MNYKGLSSFRWNDSQNDNGQNTNVYTLHFLQNNPTFYLAYALRGYAKTEVKDYYCATRDLDDAIALNPELSLAYYFRAHLNEKINNPKNAKKDYALADTKQDISYKDISAAFGHSVSSPEGNSSSDNFILYKKMVDILFQY